ncbi:MAG: transcription termination factor NusA [Planctomycetes bacterium]|nr:transcription termination factor NusA [Planctomycetota bacterium]
MKGSDLLRILDEMQHQKNIEREIIFSGIEAALQLAAEKKYGEGSGVVVNIDRDTGNIVALRGEESLDPAEFGRIAAQSAKNVMIQKIREAECSSVFNEYAAMKGDLVHGAVTRNDGGACIINLGKTEAILPRGEQIPGESHHMNERIKGVVLEVKKQGHRVKIVLSRTHPDFVRRLFEGEIPEIKERTIEIKAIAREAGYRAKIAVSSVDMKVDCVGACVGVRGSRIKNIVDELGGERIDIVRWNESLQVMIPNALQPAQIDDVFLYPRMGRAIVLVKEDQLSLAIGRRGQNVRLASKLVGWDIEIMTLDEMNESIERAVGWFQQIPHVSDDLVEIFITEGFMSYVDITFIEPVDLAEMGSVTVEQAEEIIAYAEEAAERIENQKPEEAAANEEANAGRTVAGHLDEPALVPAADGAPMPSPEEAAVESPLEESSTEADLATSNETPDQPVDEIASSVETPAEPTALENVDPETSPAKNEEPPPPI